MSRQSTTPIHALLDAYAQGVFPMADSRDSSETYWVEPKMRGIIPLDEFNIPRSFQKFLSHPTYSYDISFNQDFRAVIKACAEAPRNKESGTWINHEIESWFVDLHDKGYAHSVEVWDGQKNLIGGLYGLSIGGCFNGESMFSKVEGASKIALVTLVNHLKNRGYCLLDTQFINDHLKQFGCIEIPQADYLEKLESALQLHVTFI